ncbi:complement factor H-related protein 2-like isoform X2 [Garra rufa]|uniref:complement factor H-related protein 2-like isoform X2 n=1 Tax=Garra rufa TaxID=137080 RepID=UPI003CCE940D
MKYCEIFLFLQLTIMDVSTKVVCEGEQLTNVDIVVGNPGTAPPYKPGHILVFRCTDVKLKMYGQRTIECLSDGKWDYPYPKCGDVTCPLNTTENNIKITRFPDLQSPVKPGHKLMFSCNGQGLILKGQREITCQSNGEWSSPFPKCEKATCVANLTENMIIESEVSIIPGHTLKLSCDGQGLILKGQREITCQSSGEWSSPFPKCEMRTECGPPPYQENADTVDITKKEYSYGEKVKYMCFNKFIMEGYPYLTCAQGEWRGYFTCLKPCTVTVEEMDKRGIELQWGGRQKIFSPHKDIISFACQTGKYLKDETNLRQTCTNGVMLLPRCA